MISGGTGLDLIEAAYPPEVLAHFDVVAYDPRGVGRSTPLIQCAGGLDPDLDLDAADTEAVEAAERTEVEACMADTGLDVLRHTGSDEATNDVDLLRAVLGEERINLLAYSYGTQIRCTRCAFLATTGPRFWTASSTSQNGRTTCAWGRNAAIRPRSPD